MQLNKTMKTKTLFTILVILLFLGCKEKLKEPDFYKNLYTEELVNKQDIVELIKKLHEKHDDSIKGQAYITIHYSSLLKTKDSIIRPFKYDVRVGNEYKVRANSYEKLGINIPKTLFKTISGDRIQIGGKQAKPTLINLWFVACGGCIAEMPALNKLQEKYADKVNFVSITFDKQKDVSKFLKRKTFNFNHITDANDFIKNIGSKPYPENIFIDREGTIKYIEGGLADYKDLDLVIKHFESLIQKLLLPTNT